VEAVSAPGACKVDAALALDVGQLRLGLHSLKAARRGQAGWEGGDAGALVLGCQAERA
jgi:hypothetical protein